MATKIKSIEKTERYVFKCLFLLYQLVWVNACTNPINTAVCSCKCVLWCISVKHWTELTEWQIFLIVSSLQSLHFHRECQHCPLAFYIVLSASPFHITTRSYNLFSIVNVFKPSQNTMIWEKIESWQDIRCDNHSLNTYNPCATCNKIMLCYY